MSRSQIIRCNTHCLQLRCFVLAVLGQPYAISNFHCFGCRLQDKSDSEQDLEKRAQLRKLQRRLQIVSVKANMSAKAILRGIRQTGLDNILQQMHAWP